MEIEQFIAHIVSERTKLFQFAFRLLNNREEAEDAVQETLIRLWNMRDRLDQYSNPAALATTITRNICLDRLRRKDRHHDSCEQEIPEHGESLQKQVEQKDACRIVAACIEQLPELQQATLRLRDVEGYELSEIAQITGSSPEAVRMNLSRARKKVRDMYFKIENYEQSH